jgi:hypothetical protein
MRLTLLAKVFIVLCGALGAAWWWQARTTPQTADSIAVSSTAASPAVGTANTAATNGKIAANAVLSIDPRVMPAAPQGTRRPQPALAPLTQEYLTQRNYAQLYAKLLTERSSGEVLALKASILARCGTRTDKPPTEKPQRNELREKFIAALPKGHPDNALRLQAYDDMTTDGCAGFPTTPITGPEIDALRTAAAAAGDPLAQARELECAIFANESPADDPAKSTRPPTPPPLSDEQFANFKAILASGDARAVDFMGMLLANTYSNGSIRIGANTEEIDSHAMRYASEILACDMGLPCTGTNHPRRWSCAYENKCNASNLSDYLSFYEMSPHQTQTVDRVRQKLQQMIESKDFSDLQFVKGERTSRSTSRWGAAECKS